MTRLAEIRATVARWFIVYLWAHLPLIAGVGYLLDSALIIPLVTAAVCAAAATLTWWRARGAAVTRYTSAVALMVMPSLLVFQFAGHPWQIDMHMYFFATLAMLAAFCDWRSILLATATVALHHLVLNFALPMAVFPAGGDFFRVVVHAVVVILESATLTWISFRMVAALQEVEEVIIKSETAQLENSRMAENQRQIETTAAEERRAAMQALARDLEVNVMGIVKSVDDAANGLTVSAEALNSTANSAVEGSNSVGETAQVAAGNAQTVAAAAEQLTASIQEISHQVGNSSNVAQNAAQQADGVMAKVGGLAEASQRIGEIVHLINDIASQTNLLALNATIEAARAGDAGKGFAVVASEVKNLAVQTSNATEEISGQINAIQDSTSEAVSAIEQINGVIREINDISAAVAAAVSEQGQATGEISQSAHLLLDSNQKVNDTIRDVSSNMDETGRSTTEVLEAARKMSGRSQDLRQHVDGFMKQIAEA
jgi:methyl-accepting chemotaxis protein